MDPVRSPFLSLSLNMMFPNSDSSEYGPPLPDSRLVRRSSDTDQVELSPQISENNQSDADMVESNQSDVMSDKPPSDSVNMEELEHVTDPEIQQLLDDDDDYSLQLDSDRPRYYYEEENKRVIQKAESKSPTDPKFIVTLDGVDPQTYQVIPEHRPQQIQVHSVKTLVDPSLKRSLLGSSLNETVKPQKHQIVTVQPMETEAIKMEEITKVDSPVYSKITPPKIKPFNINLKDTDDEDEGEVEMEAEGEGETPTEVKQSSVLERCRFWPACANGNDCQYIHPSVPCKTFPYCKFGDKCIYIHPNCKYDAKCTRMDCPFTHAMRRGGGFPPTVIHQYIPMTLQQPRIPVMPKQSSASTLDCRFYPNCHNMNCPFNHPKPCRFGVSCANKTVCRFYHPPLPTKDKMKWAAGPALKTDTISGDGDSLNAAIKSMEKVASSSSLSSL